MSHPFHFEITQEMVDAIPEEHRALWQQTLDARKERDRHVEELVAARQFGMALNFCESQERAAALIDFDERYHLTDDEVRSLLTDYWSVTEAWSGDERLRDGMYGLLKRVAPLVVLDDYDDTPDEHEALIGQSDVSLTIYRGNLGETPGTGSWTLDRKTAETFASMAMSLRGMFLGMHRDDGVPSVWRAEVTAKDVLGYFNDRGESEVVVDGVTLRNIELIAQAVGDNPEQGEHE